MTKFRVLFHGEDKYRTIEGKRIDSSLFSYECRGRIGLMLAYKRKGVDYCEGFSPPVRENRIISAYRGMKIAERIEDFYNNTQSILGGCYFAGHKEGRIHPLWIEPANKVRERIEQTELDKILRSIPEDLDETIMKLQEEQIPFCEDEIVEAFQQGLIKDSPSIQKVLNSFIDWLG